MIIDNPFASSRNESYNICDKKEFSDVSYLKSDLITEKRVVKDLPPIPILDLLNKEIAQNKEFLKAKLLKSEAPKQNLNFEYPYQKRFPSILILNHLKFFKKNHLKYITNDNKLLEDFKSLDNKKLTEKLFIPFFYISKVDSEDYERNINSDPLFTKLVNSLGIKLTEDNIKTGYFNDIKILLDSMEIIYCRSYFKELIFLMPSPKCNGHESLLYQKIIVVWNARLENRFERKIPSIINNKLLRFDNEIAIVLTPMRNGMIRVNIVEKVINKPEVSTCEFELKESNIIY